MEKHTEIPWMMHDMEACTIVTVKKPGQPIALCEARNLDDDTNEANAAFIVKAVNNHDRLVAALGGMIGDLDSIGRLYGGYDLGEARAALGAVKDG